MTDDLTADNQREEGREMSKSEAQDMADRAERVGVRNGAVGAIGGFAFLHAGGAALGYIDSPLPDAALSILLVVGVCLFLYGIASFAIGVFLSGSTRQGIISGRYR